MLRVGLDTSPLTLTRAGTARYLTNILDGLEADPEFELHRYDWGGDGKATRVVRDTGWYRFTLPRAAQRDGVQVLHCPTMRAPFRSRVPLVVTIHDAAVLRHPDAFNRWTRTYSAKSLPRVAKAADRIVVGSEFTRDELVELLGVPESKISVIPYGVGPPFAADGPAADGEYLLAVSTLEPRKNLARLLEGFRRSGLDGLELRVVGAEGWGDVSVDGERVRRLTGVDDEELARLYRGACGGRLRLALRRVRPARARGNGVRAAGRRCPRAARSASSHTASRSRSIPATPTRSPTACAGQSPQERKPSAPSGQPTTAGNGRSRLTPTCTASSRGEAARRHRRGRARASPHWRRDVRRGAAARARAARRRGAPGGGYAPPGPRARRNRADRARGPEPVGADGLRAAATPRRAAARRWRTSTTSSRRAIAAARWSRCTTCRSSACRG